MARLTQVVNILSGWGYISVIRIKTKPDPCLKITVKRTADFQKNFDEFATKMEVKMEAKETRKAEKEAAAAKGDATNDKEEVAQPTATASEDQEESPIVALVEPATDALTEV